MFINKFIVVRTAITAIIKNNYIADKQTFLILKNSAEEMLTLAAGKKNPEKIALLCQKLLTLIFKLKEDVSLSKKNIELLIIIVWSIELELLYQPLSILKGAGKVFCAGMQKKNVSTINDLIEYFPYNYETYRVTNIRDVEPEKYYQIAAVVKSVKPQYIKPAKKYFTNVIIEDSTGIINCRFFGNPAIFKRIMKIDSPITVTGKVTYYNAYYLINPEFKMRQSELVIGAEFIKPVYSLAVGISYGNFKKMLNAALDEYLPIITDCLTTKLISEKRFSKLSECILFLHQPENQHQLEYYRYQMIYRNFYFFQFMLQTNRQNISRKKSATFDIDLCKNKIDTFINNLGFELTNAQKKVFCQITDDLKKTEPMRRLLQGDVGSGKTVIAVLASIIAVENGYQSIVMCPSEILSLQHLAVFDKLLKSLNYKICLLTSALKSKDRKNILSDIAIGEYDIIIGTHSIIQEDIKFYKPGLVVIDEQHRFGVKQRAMASAHHTNPHLLLMTATPIPRTLGLTIFSDFDISVIDEKPLNRKNIITEIIKTTGEQNIFEKIKTNAKTGYQTFIVYPVIDENSKRELKSVEARYNELATTVFENIGCAMIHGRMKTDEREKIMRAYAQNEIKILFTTTIIEVGIDMPNANIIVIEHPECFGLAQLHQLRGRVGRNDIQSYCYMIISDEINELSLKRIEKFCALDDGLKLAEFDMENRGIGDFIGQRQSGLSNQLIKDMLKYSDLMIEIKNSVKKMFDKSNINSDWKYKYLQLKYSKINRGIK